MEKHDLKKRRGTAINSAPSRQVIHPDRKSLTVVYTITFQNICEVENQSPQMLAGGIDDEWENWAASHPNSAF